MNFEGNVIIEKVIIHILNHKENIHKLSEFEISLNNKLNFLLQSYINDSIRSPSRVFAKFNDIDNVVKNSSIKILQDDNEFIEESKKISRQLFKSMKGTNASAANLLVVKYRHGLEKAIGVFKIDFNDSFLTEEKEEKGKIKIVINTMNNGFSITQKLQKCVLIYDDIINEADSSILLLDKQDDNVSDYFVSRFLECELLNNSKKSTKSMIKGILEIINNEYGDDPIELINKTHNLTSLFDTSKKFKLDIAIKQIFPTENLQKKATDIINKKKIDNTFDINEDQVKKQLNRRSITTSNGIKLKGKASLFNTNEISVGESYEDGTVDIIIKKVKIIENKL
ncbi:nucleoid-associated protein [Clostridium sp.]|uniref:nucleoid-associated protein n=1 Tax=Clostridium sp. TaxID=1506 RepID=UPI003216C9DF